MSRSGYDFEIGDWGTDNVLTKNKVSGFDVNDDGLDDLGSNKVIPSN